MLLRLVEQRLSPRKSIKGSILIRSLNHENLIKASLINISPGGLQFVLAWGEEILKVGDTIDITFNEYNQNTIITAEVRYQRCGILNDSYSVFYGVKFINISLECWKKIASFLDYTNDNQIFMEESKEQRRETRAFVSQKVRIQTEGGSITSAILEDVSFGGAKIYTPQALPVNANISIHFTDHKPPFYINGVCLWCNYDETRSLQYESCSGIAFHDINSEQFNLLRSLIFINTPL